MSTFISLSDGASDRPARPPSESRHETGFRAALGLRPLWVYQVLAGLVVAFFLVRSGLDHMSNYYHFLASVYSYELVGPGLGRFCAMVLPPLQLVLAACFVVRRFVGGAFLVSPMLLAIFTVAQVSVLARGLEIGCGCFGAAVRSPVGGESMMLVGFLLFCSLSGLACWIAGQRSTQPEGRAEASA